MKNTGTLILWLDRLHWLWLALAAPLMLFPNPKRSLALLIVPGTWLLHWYVVRRQMSTIRNQQSSFPLTPLNSALVLLAFMVLVSEWATYDLAFSLPKISGMVLGFGVFFAVVRESEHLRGWWLGLVLFLAFGVGVAGLGLVGTNWFSTKFLILNTLTGRIPQLIRGLQGAERGFHPNEVAGALTWVLPVFIVFSVFLLFSPRRTRSAQRKEVSLSAFSAPSVVKLQKWQLWGLRLVIWLSTLFVAGVFVLTQSRGGYIGLALACLGMFFLALPPRGRWITLGVLAVGAVAAGIAVQHVGLEPIQNWVMGSPLAEGSGLSLNTLEGRLEIWSRAIYGLQDFPFTGMGMNTFRKVVHVLYPLFLVAPDVDIGHAHNEFLQAGLDLGIPGLIAFIALYLGAFGMLGRLWFRQAQPAALVLGLGGGLFAHLLYGLTDAVALGAKPGVLFWMLLGLIAGLYNLSDGRVRRSEATRVE